MSDPTKASGGGFHFGNIGGSVSMNAGGDIVGGNKVTTTTTNGPGFAREDDKQQFQAQIEQLRETLRAIKAAIETHPTLSVDDKEAITAEIIQHVSALKTVKDTTATVAVGAKPSEEVATAVETTLDRASQVIEKIKTVTKQAGDVGSKIGDLVVKYGPLLMSARHFFGLP